MVYDFLVQIKYVGPSKEVFSLRGKHPRTKNIVYRFSNQSPHNIKYVAEPDAEILLKELGADGKNLYVLHETG